MRPLPAGSSRSLTSPLSIAANTTYVVSVNTGNTYYVATNGGLSSQVVNGDLSSVVGNNGLYGSTGTFPTNSYQGFELFPGHRLCSRLNLQHLRNGQPDSEWTGNHGDLERGGQRHGHGRLRTATTRSAAWSTAAIRSRRPSPASRLVRRVRQRREQRQRTGANFTATAVPTYSISGTISALARSGTGTTVTLSGAEPAPRPRLTRTATTRSAACSTGATRSHRPDRLHV